MLPSPERRPLLHVASVSGLALIGFLVVFLPGVWSRAGIMHAQWEQRHPAIDPFDEGASDFGQPTTSVLPAAQRHAAYLLGYLSQLVPGCTRAPLTNNLLAACNAPVGSLMTHGNYALQLAQVGIKPTRFDYDGTPFNHLGHRIRFPSLADEVAEFGFSFTGNSTTAATSVANRLLGAFTHYQLSDIPGNGRWDLEPLPRFGFRACFISHTGNMVSVSCYPGSTGAAT